MTNIPLLDLKAQNEPLLDELMAACGRVLSSGQLVLGQEVERFEAEMAQYLGARHAIGVSSGTDALLLALMSLGVGPGDDVLCPSFTFFATAGCVRRVGARPVFVDSEADSFNMDPADLDRKITKNAKAAIPAHLFGKPAAIEAIREICRVRGLSLIEDCAQSLGAKRGGSAVGCFGDVGAFSFYPSKILSAFGDAGLAAIEDDRLAEKARRLRVHGGVGGYRHEEVGGNFRIDALQAALLSVKRPHLDAFIAKRVGRAQRYSALLETELSGRVAEGDAEAFLVRPASSADEVSCWNQYTIRVPGGRRDGLQGFLKENGVATAVYYPIPLHQQACFADVVDSGVSLPVAERLCREVLSLPMFPELADSQQDRVVDLIKKYSETA